jgi:penicillin-binding protein 2
MLGDKLGIDKIVKYADEFGYGQKTGIDLPGEQSGLMPSPEWLIRNYHHRWYPDETLDVAIGQGAIEATPIQLARIIGGIASGGHMVRPHSVFPNELPPEFYKSLLDSFPGTGDAYVPMDPQNWTIITDGMADVTQPGLYHTAGGEHLEGIDFAGKTGTAQQMSHAALEKTSQGRSTFPNVWFVGVVPRRNPELVVAVLWQTGNKSWFPARIGAQVIKAFVDKKRREANNLPANAPKSPVEVGAVWSMPDPGSEHGAAAAGNASWIHSGHFFVDGNGELATSAPAAKPASKQEHKTAVAKATGTPVVNASQLASALPVRRKDP